VNQQQRIEQRMQSDVQRNVNQQQRIANGRIQRSENHQSARVYRKKHNARAG
jgi:hypothetical protein